MLRSRASSVFNILISQNNIFLKFHKPSLLLGWVCGVVSRGALNIPRNRQTRLHSNKSNNYPPRNTCLRRTYFYKKNNLVEVKAM